ncbi:MAG TPA: hypothetical protein VJ489_00305, partial [Thermoplasmata archaeon]|nr:hypothetical protein [Thermoplasmata archaeon]
YAILLEDALKRSDVILAPDGVIGNIIFRSLHLVAGAKAYGAPILNIPTVFVDTSRAKADYLDSVLFAAGLVGLKCDKGPQH